MRLSELGTDALMDVLYSLTEPACAIMTDSDVGSALAALWQARDTHAPMIRTLGQLLAKLGPVLLGKRRDEVYAILSVMTDQTEAQLRTQPGLVTLRQLTRVWDEELSLFFASAAPTEQTTCSPSSHG